MRKLVQIDFPIEGPWGEEMSAAYTDLAHDIAGEAGLLWKIWTENQETGEQGGVYVFEDGLTAQAYVTKHTERLQAFGITNARIKVFDINKPLTQITGQPFG